MQNVNIVFVSLCDVIAASHTGGEQLAKAHYNLFCKIFTNDMHLLLNANGKSCDKITYCGHTKSKIATLINSIFGRIRGYTRLVEKNMLKEVKRLDPDVVYIDFSCFGSLAKKIKKYNNNIKIISFFHNFEAGYEYNRFKKESALYFFSYLSAKKQEELTVKYSDRLICLNDRDEALISKHYGAIPDLKLPIVLMDNFNIAYSDQQENYLLFVGALFNPNYDGIKWFINNVAPYINKKVKVVGKDFEIKRDELQRSNVEIVGTVDNLDEYYYNAEAVIMPILYGDGMKVKTCEALMYGKTVLGTSEAFEGYRIKNGKEGYLLNTAREWIDTINAHVFEKYNEFSRDLFIREYSFETAAVKMEELVGAAINGR